jgi:hypothetical protein
MMYVLYVEAWPRCSPGDPRQHWHSTLERGNISKLLSSTTIDVVKLLIQHMQNNDHGGRNILFDKMSMMQNQRARKLI